MVKGKASFAKKIEVEVTKVEDALKAAKAGVDLVMLDNFSPRQIDKACKLLKEAKLYGRVLLEASGGITEANVLSFASTGVDIVSLGEITSGAKPLNMSLEVSRVTGKPASPRLRGEKRSNRLR
jgi:nicotinate-nucleotide pyrophosphorylase (carboxylating)